MEKRKQLTRKIREGIVISNKMIKTLTVRVDKRILHPLFQKSILRSKKYYVHNENKEISVGSRVRFVETRPLSKLKRWRVLEVLRENNG